MLAPETAHLGLILCAVPQAATTCFSSIVALDADTVGWYITKLLRATVGTTATQHIILADILWDGDEGKS